MFYVADTTVLAVGVQSLVHGALCTHLVAEHTCRCTAIDTLCLGIYVILKDGVFLYVLGQCGAVYALNRGVNQTALGQFAKQVEHTAGTAALLHAVLLAVGSQFAQEGSLAREFVHILHGEVHLGLLSHGKQVQNGVGAGTHGYVQSHGIHESLTSCYAAGQDTLVAILVVCKGILHYLSGSILEELYAVGMCGQDGAVAGQGQADALGEVVHGVGGEHAATASASGACTVFHLCQFLVANGLVGTLHHGGYQVEVLALVLASLHRTAANEHRGDVQAHGSHQHAGGYLVAIGDANHGICLVGVAHILHAVCYDVAAGQRIEHAIVTHCYTIINSNGIELGSIASHALYLGLHYLTNLVQMCVTRHKLCEGVHYGYDGLAKHLSLHAVCHPQGSCAGHTATLCTHGTSQLVFHFAMFSCVILTFCLQCGQRYNKLSFSQTLFTKNLPLHCHFVTEAI